MPLAPAGDRAAQPNCSSIRACRRSIRASRKQAGSIIVLEDITDRANLEEQLGLSEKMAAIGVLAAGVAHEVDTPLTGISSFTQMLLERSEADDPRKPSCSRRERQTFPCHQDRQQPAESRAAISGETGAVETQ